MFTLYNPESFFLLTFYFRPPWIYKSLTSPLDFLTIKSLTVETMIFAGNMFIENNGEEATLKHLKKKIEETFGVNLYPTLMKLEK